MKTSAPFVPLLFCSLLTSQTIVVDPNGSGNYSDLQTAINAAPANAVIHVVGGTWEALSVTRSVTIVAEPIAVISQTLSQGIGQQPPAITLQGTGTETFTLVNAVLRGTIDCVSWNYAGAGIDSTDFAAIRVFDCWIRGADWLCVTGRAGGVSGILARNANSIYVERSTIAASAAWPGLTHEFGLDGAPGITAPGADVVVAQSRVEGGDCETSYWPSFSPGPFACPCPGAAGVSGIGGPGILASNLLDIGSIVNGGSGCEVRWRGQPWGKQPDGPATMVGSSNQLPVSMVLASELSVGGTGEVQFAWTQDPALFVTGFPTYLPTTVAAVNHVFVDANQPFATLYLPPNSQVVQTQVPAWSGLIGLAFAHQRFDLVAGAIVPSNPIVAVVRP
ncbi:MAG: hypothetical protein NXI31_05155 [bacterium]|nr:hypothetical protein [bacterium]